MLRFSGGDARKLLNILELVVESDTEETVVITDDGDRTSATESVGLRQGRGNAL